MKLRWVLGLEWLMLAAACDDGHVVGDPITAGSQTGPQAGATTTGGVHTTPEGTAGGGAPLLGTGGNVPTAGGAVASGGATLLAAGGAFTGGATSLSVGGAFTGGATSLSAGGALLTGGSTSVGNSAPVCVLYVATSGDDRNDGRLWSSAFANVQTAIDTGTHLVDNDDCSAVEVWVAEGTYKPTYLDDSTDARTATFQLAANVALYGGFAGTESKQSDRNIDSHVTILTGDIGNQDDTKDNSYHVVTGEPGARLDGFTVTGGNADAPYVSNPDRDASVDDSKSYGGGMLNEGTSPTIANCTFVNNSAREGGGMFNDGASPTVANCTFADNRGSAIYNASAAPTIANCKFTNNTGSGDVNGWVGMSNVDSSPTVTNCTFSGGGIYNLGGTPIITGCTFTNNYGMLSGHGMGVKPVAGAMYNDYSSPTVTNCTFTDNRGYWGGAMYNNGSSPLVTNCTFTGNVAENYGGGMCNEGGAPIITNCTFANNSTKSLQGGAMYNDYSSPIVTNCTFVNNSATGSDGGGMYNYGSSPRITNSIFWNDTAESSVREQLDGSTMSNSIVQDGYTAGTNIINSDPLFVDPANGDFRLSAGSPAIDSGGCASGLAATDILGNPRWNISSVTDGPGNGVDIGAYEYQGAEGTDRVVTDLACQ